MSNPSAVPDEIRYVGFWLRVGAALIDTVVVSVVLDILLRLMGLSPKMVETDQLDPASLLIDIQDPHALVRLVLNVLLPAVAVIVLWLRLGATPGKMIIGAEVVDAKTLGPLTPAQSVLRYVGYFASIAPLCLGLIWVGLDARKQGFHDKIAGTLVIRKRRSSP